MDIDINIINDMVRSKMIDKISGLELPSTWTPDKVLDYIIYILEKDR
jgi:hypothetical protein